MPVSPGVRLQALVEETGRKGWWGRRAQHRLHHLRLAWAPSKEAPGGPRPAAAQEEVVEGGVPGWKELGPSPPLILTLQGPAGHTPLPLTNAQWSTPQLKAEQVAWRAPSLHPASVLETSQGKERRPGGRTRSRVHLGGGQEGGQGLPCPLGRRTGRRAGAPVSSWLCSLSLGLALLSALWALGLVTSRTAGTGGGNPR